MTDKTPTTADRAAIMAFFKAGRALFQATLNRISGRLAREIDAAVDAGGQIEFVLLMPACELKIAMVKAAGGDRVDLAEATADFKRLTLV
jgi:hypothetical protein